ATVLRVAPTGRYPAHCPAEFGLSSLRPGSFQPGRTAIVWTSTAVPTCSHVPECSGFSGSCLAIILLRDGVLLELFVEIAAWSADDLRRFRDVPGIFAELVDQERPFGGFLELAESARTV